MAGGAWGTRARRYLDSDDLLIRFETQKSQHGQKKDVVDEDCAVLILEVVLLLLCFSSPHGRLLCLRQREH